MWHLTTPSKYFCIFFLIVTKNCIITEWNKKPTLFYCILMVSVLCAQLHLKFLLKNRLVKCASTAFRFSKNFCCAILFAAPRTLRSNKIKKYPAVIEKSILKFEILNCYNFLTNENIAILRVVLKEQVNFFNYFCCKYDSENMKK